MSRVEELKTAKSKTGVVLMVLAGILGAALVVMAIGSKMMSDAASPPPSPNGNPVEPDAMVNPVDWNYWKGVNPDVVAWIKIPGTSIDLPVVQAHEDDPQHYLSHDVYDNWNIWGCPYVDAGCKDGVDSLNVVIFSHNMEYGDPMFGELNGYTDEGFARENRTVLLYTPDEVRVYLVHGSDGIGGWEPVKRVSFENLKDYREYRHERLEACDTVVGHLDETGSDPMLTLVTCTYVSVSYNARTVVYAFKEGINTHESASEGIIDEKPEDAVTLRAE